MPVVNPPILFPDVVVAVTTYVKSMIPTAHTSAVIPKNLETQSQAVVVYLTGGPSRDVVIADNQVTIDSYATSKKNAHDLAQLVRAHVNSMRGQTVGTTLIYQVNEFSGPAWIPDDLSTKPMFRQTFQIGTRGTQIT